MYFLEVEGLLPRSEENLVTTLNQVNWVNILLSYFFKIPLNTSPIYSQVFKAVFPLTFSS